MASKESIEFIRDRLYWCSVPANFRVLDTDDAHYFNLDDVLKYEPFMYDFGPVDLGMTHYYIKRLNSKMVDNKLLGKRIVHCCGQSAETCANAAYLICAYMVVVHRMPADAAFAPFKSDGLVFLPFRDALRGPSAFPLTILDCLRGLEAGIQFGWYDWMSFDLRAYVHYQQIENGHMNWIIPGKFLALAGPIAESVAADTDGCTSADLAPAFLNMGIEVVVSLNVEHYEKDVFIKHGIDHVDAVFPDGCSPPAHIINLFFNVASAATGAIAVHCKAGLGRTGTLIGLYAMMHYGISARSYIAWSRLCRPGSVLGPQQQFLCDMEKDMYVLGNMRAWPTSGGATSTEYEPLDERRSRQQRKADARNFADRGQGEHLVCRSKIRTQRLAGVYA